MCHCSILMEASRPAVVICLLGGAVAVAVHFDRVDANLGVILAAALHLLVLLLALVVETENLVAAAFAHDGGETLCGRRIGDAVFAGEGEDFADLGSAILAGCRFFNL